MSDDLLPLGRTFGAAADAYHRGRPGYGTDAVRWLLGTTPVDVVELGAGTGKLTAPMVALGHEVHATDVDVDMLALLRAELPDVSVGVGGAEAIDAADGSCDVVVAAQCFHWFDLARAIPEIARVLRPGGTVAIVYQERDERIPWVRKLGRIIGAAVDGEQQRDFTDELLASGLFADVEQRSFVYWQSVTRETIADLVLSRSQVLIADDAGRERRLAEARALYDDYGRGADGMQLPYRTTCWRARVVATTSSVDDVPAVPSPEVLERRLTDSASTLPRVVLGELDDDALVLIDFR